MRLDYKRCGQAAFTLWAQASKCHINVHSGLQNVRASKASDQRTDLKQPSAFPVHQPTATANEIPYLCRRAFRIQLGLRFLVLVLVVFGHRTEQLEEDRR